MTTSAHIVHFSRGDEDFVRTAGRFLREGLINGDSCVAVATREHLAQLDAHLREAGLDPNALSAEYRYIPLRAEEMLATFFDAQGGGVHRERFHHQFGMLMQQAAARGQPVRLFGEMVSLLAEQGSPAAAIELEELWNELSRTHSFTLFCSYNVSPFTENPRYRKLLHGVHSHVHRKGA